MRWPSTRKRDGAVSTKSIASVETRTERRTETQREISSETVRDAPESTTSVATNIATTGALTTVVDVRDTSGELSLRLERAEAELRRERLAHEAERAATRDELEAQAEALARSRSECERLEAECEALASRTADIKAEERASCRSTERTLQDVCRTVTRFAVRCAEYGLIDEDVARAVEDNPQVWIEPDGNRRERVGELLNAVLDAHASVCAEYESRVAVAKAQPPDSEDVEEYERQIKLEVERVLGHLELEFHSSKRAGGIEANDSSPNSASKRLYRTPDVKSSRKQSSSTREIEAERRELQETVNEVQRQMHQLAESSKAIESELRDQLVTSRSESEKLRVELESVLEERNIIVNKLEIELQKLEHAQSTNDEKTKDAMRRAREDLEQEQRRLSLVTREKDAEISALKERVAHLDAQVDDLTSEGKRLSETLTKQRQIKDKLEEQVAGSEARIEGLLQEIDAMDAASAQASMHVSNAMASASEAHQRSLQEMRAKQSEAEAYIESLDARMGALEEERGMLRRELERAYSREKEIRVRMQESERRSNELTAEINALLEQEARRNNLRETGDGGFLSISTANTPSRSARMVRVHSNGVASSSKKLDVREFSDDDSEGEFVVVRRRATTAPSSPFMVGNSPRETTAQQFNGLNSVSSALARARAEFIEVRAKRDTFQ